MMKMLETQVGQLAGRLTTNEGKFPGQPKGPETAKAIQTRLRKEVEDLKRSTGARKPKPSAEAEEFAKEEVTETVTEEPEFEMSEEDMKIPQLKPFYIRDHVKISEQCSAAIANGLEKQKDPGCPTIPCSIGSLKFEKALCDLGASVSIMPRDVFDKLHLPLEPTGMCLELGDNSIRYHLGIAEDVPMKVGRHFIPVDFVVLEMG
jgi:hypothetical protein